MLSDTHAVFEDRKNEIEFYYSIMIDIDQDAKDGVRGRTHRTLNTIDNHRFFRIMKSNFLLMLYNLVESTFTTGMMEIYDRLKQDNCPYERVIDEIQNIWRDYKVKEVYKPESDLHTYTERVRKIVVDITQSAPISMTKEMLGINGNLNAKQIKRICDKHRIRYRVSGDQTALDSVKKKRNSLAHGDESFSRCARDFSLSDLEKIKDSVVLFVEEILTGMDVYYDNQQYLRSTM